MAVLLLAGRGKTGRLTAGQAANPIRIAIVLYFRDEETQVLS